jgi:lysozyme family protein
MARSERPRRTDRYCTQRSDLPARNVAGRGRWAKAKLTRNFAATAKSLVAAKPRYQTVEARTGVPWWVIAVIHERESDQNWHDSLAQGDPWNQVSRDVPKGRGPFKSWEEAAIDALVNCDPHLARKSWRTAGEILTNLEAYNGLGYYDGPVTKRDGVIVARYGSQPSPYIWAGTDQYKSGKYVADGVYSPSVSDIQPGCAGIILSMMALDPSIVVGGTRPVAPAAFAAPTRDPTPASSQGLGAAIGAFFSAIAGIFTRQT